MLHLTIHLVLLGTPAHRVIDPLRPCCSPKLLLPAPRLSHGGLLLPYLDLVGAPPLPRTMQQRNTPNRQSSAQQPVASELIPSAASRPDLLVPPAELS